MQVYPDRFEQQLHTAFPSVVLLFGDEPQQKIECIDILRQHAVKQGFNERQTLVADSEFEWSQLLEASQSMSLFADKQYIELELPTGKPGAQGAKAFTELANTGFEDLLVLVHGPKIGKDVQSAKWFKTLSKAGFFTLCYPQEGQRLSQWISQYLTKTGLQADRDSIALLAENCEGNLLAARQEIEKLALIFPDGILDREKVASVTVDQSRFTVFQLVDALLGGDMQRAVKILYRLESEGVEPNIVIWALVREWQVLTTLSNERDAGRAPNWQKMRIWKNKQSLYQAALNRLSSRDLLHLQDKLQTADLAFKQTTQAKPFIALCHLCMLFLPASLADFPL